MLGPSQLSTSPLGMSARADRERQKVNGDYRSVVELLRFLAGLAWLRGRNS